MAKIPKSASASEMLEILKKQWLNTKDIKILASVGYEKAIKIKKEIIKNVEEQGYFLPSGLVPSEEVIKYLNLNIKYLKKVSEWKEV